jgi:hypothetical protein
MSVKGERTSGIADATFDSNNQKCRHVRTKYAQLNPYRSGLARNIKDIKNYLDEKHGYG